MQNFGMTSLGSGSSGNATVIHAPGGKFLVDAGFCAKELERRLRLAGIEPEEIRALLITHEHSDHICGCRVFSDRYGIPVYATEITARVLANAHKIGKKIVLMTPGSVFELCGVSAEPFTVPHDAGDTVGFSFRCGEGKIGIATDLGCLNASLLAKLAGCNALLIESNHDRTMLRNCKSRPVGLIRRIMSNYGHLSNEQTISAFSDLLCPCTKYLTLGHLSGECNDPELVRSLALRKLEELHREDIELCIALQDSPGATEWVF